MLRFRKAEPMTRAEVASLYERFGYAVFRRCLRVVGSEAAAEDVLQDVFVRVMRYGTGFRGDSALAWLQRIADRACLDRIARERPRWWQRDREVVEVEEAPAAAEPAQLLREILAALPQKLGQVAILYHVDGMDQAAIARTLACSTMTVKRRLRALRRAARALTAERGEGLDDADLAT